MSARPVVRAAMEPIASIAIVVIEGAIGARATWMDDDDAAFRVLHRHVSFLAARHFSHDTGDVIEPVTVARWARKER
jgi:hypothetical protein